MKNRNLIILYVIGITAFILSLMFDKSIILYSLKLRIGFLNEFMRIITSYWIVIVFIAIGFFILIKKKKSFVLLVSAAGAFITANLLKLIIARPRAQIEHLVIESSYSMPSSHAMVLFAMLPVLYKEHPKLLWLWLIIILVIVFSRFYLGVHYLSDLILGAMIGYLIGIIALWSAKKYGFEL